MLPILKIFYTVALLFVSVELSFCHGSVDNEGRDITDIGSKSRQKCKEYEQLAKTPIGGGPSATKAECSLFESTPLIFAEPRSQKYPHMAIIGFDRENGEKIWLCSGSLISEQFVLTAAHCLYSRAHGDAKYIRLGDLDISTNTDDAEPQDFKIIQAYSHPDYKPPLVYNDIALLKINSAAQLNPYVNPACLDTASNLTRKAVQTGWSNNDFSEFNQQLLEQYMNFIPQAECNNSYKAISSGRRLKNGIVNNIQVCAASSIIQKYNYVIHSGAPLQIYDENGGCFFKIIGVTSFGSNEKPTVFTRVSAYIGWIEEIVWL